MCAKLKVQVIFRSRDRGSNGMKMGQKWVFHGFLENYSVDLIPSPRERRFCNSTYVCQGAGAGYFSSPRYRVKMGPSILGNTKGVFVYSHGAEYDYTLIYSYYVYQVPRQLKLSQSPRGTLQFSTSVEP